MKKILVIFGILFTVLTGNAQDSLDSAFIKQLEKGVGIVDDSLVTMSALQQSAMDQVFLLQTEVQTQKFLKTIFLLGFIFMTIVVIILFVVYYTKIRQIIKLIDIQEREIKIRQFEVEKLSIILNNTMDAASITDKTGKVIWANRSFERIFGFNPDMKEYNIFDTDDPEIQKLHEQCRKEHKPVQYTKEIITDKGERKWIQRRIIPLVNDKNEILNFAVIDTDYTALKLATEKNQK